MKKVILEATVATLSSELSSEERESSPTSTPSTTKIAHVEHEEMKKVNETTPLATVRKFLSRSKEVVGVKHVTFYNLQALFRFFFSFPFLLFLIKIQILYSL